jgi:hypothetical protein
MIPKRAGAVVETIVHPKTKREARMRLDKRTMWFHVTIGDGEAREYFESKDGTAVRQWAMGRLALTTDETKLDWKAVIEVAVSGSESWRTRYDSPSKRDESVKISINRYWVALTSDETEWRSIQWEQGDDDSPTAIEPALRYAQSREFWPGPKSKKIGSGFHMQKPFTIPYFDGGGKSYLPYDPMLWAGLVEMCDTVKRAMDTMQNIIQSKRGMATLKAVGAGKQQFLLNPGS